MFYFICFVCAFCRLDLSFAAHITHMLGEGGERENAFYLYEKNINPAFDETVKGSTRIALSLSHTRTSRDWSGTFNTSKTFQALGKTACCLSSRNLRRFSTRKMCAIPTGTRIFLSLKVRAYRPCTLIGCDVEITSSVVEMHRWLEFFHHFHAGSEFLDHHYDSHNSKLNSKVSGIRTDSLAVSYTHLTLPTTFTV